ncbi:hypothetical protein ACFPH6_10015 [Streptomyces xiangluensis]|uniref:MT0933-like antitoxin protein n=1 Tax=Streptomyces xiangluensis TaxID=2665720 RepID=A0ABV8YKN5_9ACTN
MEKAATAAQKIGTAMYEQSRAAGERSGQTGQAGAGGDDEVVDAEIVDDDSARTDDSSRAG